MTEKERIEMLATESEAMDHLNAEEIGEIMRIVTGEDGSEKIGNVLFSAVVKAFVLGYIRGSKKRR